jgi:ATP-dependent Lon protease
MMSQDKEHNELSKKIELIKQSEQIPDLDQVELKEVQILPVLPLRGINVFPKMFLHFDAKRAKSVKALDAGMRSGQLIFVVAQKDASKEEVDIEKDVYGIGTIVRIKQIVKLPGNIARVLVEGLSRGKALSYTNKGSYPKGEIQLVETQRKAFTDNQYMALMGVIENLIDEYKLLNSKMAKETLDTLSKITDVGFLADSMATHMIKPIENKQRILEELSEDIRMQLVVHILNNEIEVGKIQQDLHNKVKSNIDQNQKEYYLREQMKVIQTELGDKIDTQEEIDDYKRKLDSLNASTEVKEKISKEIKRLNKMTMGSAEGSVIRSYIECLLEMPWNTVSIDNDDLVRANAILEQDHYGLTKVKERVIEHLAVRKMTHNSAAPIICLVGPPGTGKTSIAKSIAHAVNRQYVRMSLGGVRDEAEIRGHRRTYIGAMPGRIVHSLKQAKTSNPLILLDEIDKLGNDYKGDPSAALLEVLDSEQNNQFRDHFVELPVDLSKVLFVATANSLRTIPRPLLDRLEIIEVASYTENEKNHIAVDYLWPKQLEKHGLTKTKVKLTEQALKRIINEYTKEAGVRQLERLLGELCRKSVKSLLLDEKKTIRIGDKNLENFLGIPKYQYLAKASESSVGIARGLAWTELGGETLSIEVTVMPGKGTFQITGRIGDVMKESASAAISYIRSASIALQIAEDFYEKLDIHIHIPEGAVPKDGPSAGITLATAVVSALTKQSVRNDIAMTGEITLRGRVLPIGGLKEKILAAKRAGIFEIIVPMENKRNVTELDAEILEGVTIHFVVSMDEVIKLTLV